MDHELKATNETVHWGFFSSTLAPKLTIQSGAYDCLVLFIKILSASEKRVRPRDCDVARS
jgi:hypothetical protein